MFDVKEELQKIWRKKIEDLTPLEYAVWRMPLAGKKGEWDGDKAAEDLAALRARVEKLEADLHQQTHETVGAEMERDELRALLKKSEFAGEGFCWSCGLYYGHDEGACELQAALRGEA